MHPYTYPPVPAVKVADTSCPAHTAASAGVFANSIGPVGCSLTVTTTDVLVAVVHPLPVALTCTL